MPSFRANFRPRQQDVIYGLFDERQRYIDRYMVEAAASANGTALREDFRHIRQHAGLNLNNVINAYSMEVLYNQQTTARDPVVRTLVTEYADDVVLAYAGIRGIGIAGVGRTSKFGIVFFPSQSRYVHFILDGIDVGAVARKEEPYGTSNTARELRCAFRYWDYGPSRVAHYVKFYRNDREVLPPWVTDRDRWRRYANHRIRRLARTALSYARDLSIAIYTAPRVEEVAGPSRESWDRTGRGRSRTPGGNRSRATSRAPFTPNAAHVRTLDAILDVLTQQRIRVTNPITVPAHSDEQSMRFFMPATLDYELMEPYLSAAILSAVELGVQVGVPLALPRMHPFLLG